MMDKDDLMDNLENLAEDTEMPQSSVLESAIDFLTEYIDDEEITDIVNEIVG